MAAYNGSRRCRRRSIEPQAVSYEEEVSQAKERIAINYSMLAAADGVRRRHVAADDFVSG